MSKPRKSPATAKRGSRSWGAEAVSARPGTGSNVSDQCWFPPPRSCPRFVVAGGSNSTRTSRGPHLGQRSLISSRDSGHPPKAFVECDYLGVSTQQPKLSLTSS